MYLKPTAMNGVNSMKFVVDRIEEGIFVVVNEKGEKFNLPEGFLKNISEGDKFEIALTDNNDEKEQLKKRLGNLFERGKNDD